MLTAVGPIPYQWQIHFLRKWQVTHSLAVEDQIIFDNRQVTPGLQSALNSLPVEETCFAWQVTHGTTIKHFVCSDKCSFYFYLYIVFKLMIATRDGVKQIDQSILQAETKMELNTLQWLQHIILPAISLNLFFALRISTEIAISALFFSKNYAT